ncbi:putative membrane protein [Propionispora sp. 2/2-37]|uniref:hypothetical protein n=1 Tax=Propionispora sp. 2/2-37 TaxID=1677858 RepID=UPI0006BB864B|nr:hypothetical protein [Propionispora sp. 2/2-37]CUH97033.1 putative membrane protein [Propionispora sp. 2/2-37]
MKKFGRITVLAMTFILLMTYFTGLVSAEGLIDGTYIATTPVNDWKISYKLTVTLENGEVTSAKLTPYYNQMVKVELTYDSLAYVPDAQKTSFKKLLDDANTYSDQLLKTSDATKVSKLPDSDDAYNALQTAWQDIVAQAQ